MAAANEPPVWRCMVVDDGTATVIRPQGELDLATVEAFRTVVDGAVAGGGRVVIDLARLTFVDSTALGFLLTTAKRARHAGVALELLPGSPRVMRLFELTRTVDVLPFRSAA